MKPLIIDGKDTNYMILENGNIINIKTNKTLKGTIRSGYRMVKLTIDGIKKDFLVHRLVAKAYLQNPLNLPQVNHKDKNRLNNNVNNLEWVNASENMHHRSQNCKSQHVRPAKNIIQLDDNWRQYLNTNYWLNQNSLCYNQKTKTILKPLNDGGKYLKYSLSVNGKGQSLLVHKMVYIAFYGKYDESLQINHKDGNTFNNTLSNLELLKRSDNVKHSYYVLRNNISEIGQYDLNENLIARHKSMTEAAKAVNGSVSAISQVCSGKLKTHKGFIWKKLV